MFVKTFAFLVVVAKQKQTLLWLIQPCMALARDLFGFAPFEFLQQRLGFVVVGKNLQGRGQFLFTADEILL